MTPAERKAIGDSAVAFAQSPPDTVREAIALAELRRLMGRPVSEGVRYAICAAYRAGIEEGLARARHEHKADMLDDARFQ